MKNFILGILVFQISFSGCVSNKQIFANAKGGDSKKEIEFINGKYSNEPLDIKSETEGCPLYEMLFKPFHTFKSGETRDNTGTIELEVISKRKIKAKYYSGGDLLKSKILRGTFKKGYFSVKRKIRPIGIPFILFKYHEVKVILGSSKNGELIVSYGRSSFGNVLIAAGGGDSYSKKGYERIE